jgi:hypothetical protein
MDAENSPWIELVPGRDEKLPEYEEAADLLPPGGGWHGQFACLVRLFSGELLNRLKWGFNRGALLDEAIERQRLFIEAQHFAGECVEEPPERRTLALRAAYDSQARGVRLALVGKAWAPRRMTARQAALEYCQAVQAIFPYDYELVPAMRREEFMRLAGWEVINASAGTGTLAEVERFEGIVSTGETRFYLLGAWKNSKYANEQFWRALAGAGGEALFSVLLRPTVLEMAEGTTLKEAADYIQKLPVDPKLPGVQQYVSFASKYYASLAEALRRPYLMQVHLVAPQGVSEHWARAVGHAATHPGDNELPAPGFQVTRPADAAAVERWRQALYWLEPEAAPWQASDLRFPRLRKLVGVQEAQALFRWPYPPEPGILGLKFLSGLTTEPTPEPTDD